MARGRPFGARGRRTREIEELIDSAPLGPAEAYIAVLNGDWKALGCEGPKRTYFLPSGIECEEPVITVDHKLSAAKELMKYRYSQKKALELSTPPEGIRIEIIDYKSKK